MVPPRGCGLRAGLWVVAGAGLGDRCGRGDGGEDRMLGPLRLACRGQRPNMQKAREPTSRAFAGLCPIGVRAA